MRILSRGLGLNNFANFFGTLTGFGSLVLLFLFLILRVPFTGRWPVISLFLAFFLLNLTGLLRRVLRRILLASRLVILVEISDAKFTDEGWLKSD